jgi:hypothetical protein
VTGNPRIDLLRWADHEFGRRTLAVKQGRGKILWGSLDHRMSLLEVAEKGRDLGVRELADPVTAGPWLAKLRNWDEWKRKIDALSPEELQDRLSRSGAG